MAGIHSSNLVHPVPIISGTLLKRRATSVCNATHTHWCSSCSCERHARLLKGQLPDTGMGNRISKLLSFAGISESLGRHVLVFWPTLGNWGRLSHRGRRFYGGLEEVRSLVHLPRALRWIEDWPAKELNGSHPSEVFAQLPIGAADEIPVIPIRHLDFGWGHPEGTWFHWQVWAKRNLWPQPCIGHDAFVASMRNVFRQMRPKVDLANPQPRSYLVLHWRRGDRGDTSLQDPVAFNLTWTCALTLIARRGDLPWLVLAENITEVPDIEERLRQHGAHIVRRESKEKLRRAQNHSDDGYGDEDGSSVRPVLRDFFAASASVGILFSGTRWGDWIDSSFSSMAALIGDVPLLFPYAASNGGNIASMQALGNVSGEALHSYFFADQIDSFLDEVAKTARRPFAEDNSRLQPVAPADAERENRCPLQPQNRQFRAPGDSALAIQKAPQTLMDKGAVVVEYAAAIELHVNQLANELQRLPCHGCAEWFLRRHVDKWRFNAVAAERARLLKHAELFGEFLPNSTRPTLRSSPSPGSYVGTFSPFDYWEAEHPCASDSRVPAHVIGDGAKWLCAAALHPAPCQIVSLGSNFDDSFERAMHTLANCSSYIVDPTLQRGEAMRKFERQLESYGATLNHSVGIGREGTLLRVRTLDTSPPDALGPKQVQGWVPMVSVASLLQHRFPDAPSAHISVLKVDIEGTEYDSLDGLWNLCATGRLTVSQLNMEIHLHDRQPIKALYALFAGARKCGLILHHKEVNTWGSPKWPCAEFAWVDLEHAQRAVHAERAASALPPCSFASCAS